MQQLALSQEFAAAMARLGPFGDKPRIAVGVSGGADSTALALLMQGWVAARGGAMLALIVDHGLRADSAAEAELTRARLAARGIDARIVTLAGLGTKAALQARARAARQQALAAAARQAGCVFLALGHHAGDQSETVAMRAGRGGSGLEAMAGWAARHDVVMLRPLLAVAPPRLREFLRALGVAWVEDPSNADPKFERVRLRQAGVGGVPADAGPRQAIERQAADFIARHVTLRPEGFAVVAAASMPAAALGALLRVVAGADYPPGRANLANLAAKLRPATLGGARIAKTAKFGGGWVLGREPAACAAPVAAVAGAMWDARFRLDETVPGAMLGALGDDAAKDQAMPAFIRRGLPCLRRDGAVLPGPASCRFVPPYPATSHPFVT